jgi:hypothetical protein
MRSRMVALLSAGLLVLTPGLASARQDQPPERLPTDQNQALPEDKPEAVGASGSEATTVVDGQPGEVTHAGTVRVRC